MKLEDLFEALSRKKSSYDDIEGLVDNFGDVRNPNEPTATRDGHENDTSDPGGEKFNRQSSASVITSQRSLEKLARVLGLPDLTLLGIGAMLGLGVYVLGGAVAKNQAGPGVIFSLVLAAVASAFSAVCYVEFASRIFKAGSAYNYTYLSIGEFAAFIIGWNLVLEYVIGIASEAKAISNQIDALTGNVYQKFMESIFHINCSFLSTYPDPIAPIIVLLMSGLISLGVQESTRINSVLTFCNIGIVVTIVISGLFKLNPANWTIAKKDIPDRYKPTAGAGGFLPFGVNGVMVGAAKCFFGFVGFDAIATTGEEAKNPRRNIPLSILMSLSIVFTCYVAIAIVLTLILPYYEQDADAPFLHIFDVLGWPYMKWLVSVGSLFSLTTGMFGALFPLPRILYSMAKDGLIYPSFAYVSPCTLTPIVSTIATGILTAILSAIFKLEQLIDMLSIGTLLAYTIVALSVLLLRYSDEEAKDSTCNCCNIGTKSLMLNPIYPEPIQYKCYSNDQVDESSQQNNVDLSNEDKFNGTVTNGTIVQNEDKFNATVNNGTIVQHENKEDFTAQESIEEPALYICETGGKECQNNTSKCCQKGNLKGYTNGTFNGCDNSDSTYYEHERIPSQNKDSLGLNNRSENNTNPEGSRNSTHCNDSNAIPHRCKHSNDCLDRFMTLFNLHSRSFVTPTSQCISKVCIYLYICLTVIVCLVLNTVTGVNLNLDGAPPLLTNQTLASPLVGASNSSVGSVNTNDGSSFEYEAFDNTELLNSLTDDSNSLSVEGSANLFASWDIPPNVQSVAYGCLGIIYIGTFLVLGRQAQNVKRLNFRVPLVPLIPCLSIFLNIYLMVNLDSSTWVRFIAWMIVGLFIYFSYGISHSKQTKVTKLS